MIKSLTIPVAIASIICMSSSASAAPQLKNCVNDTTYTTADKTFKGSVSDKRLCRAAARVANMREGDGLGQPSTLTCRGLRCSNRLGFIKFVEQPAEQPTITGTCPLDANGMINVTLCTFNEPPTAAAPVQAPPTPAIQVGEYTFASCPTLRYTTTVLTSGCAWLGLDAAGNQIAEGSPVPAGTTLYYMKNYPNNPHVIQKERMAMSLKPDVRVQDILITT